MSILLLDMNSFPTKKTHFIATIYLHIHNKSPLDWKEYLCMRQLSSHHLKLSALLFYLYSSFWLLCHIWVLAGLAETCIFDGFKWHLSLSLSLFCFKWSFGKKEKLQHILFLIEICNMILPNSFQAMIWSNIKDEKAYFSGVNIYHLL